MSNSKIIPIFQNYLDSLSLLQNKLSNLNIMFVIGKLLLVQVCNISKANNLSNTDPRFSTLALTELLGMFIRLYMVISFAE